MKKQILKKQENDKGSLLFLQIMIDNMNNETKEELKDKQKRKPYIDLCIDLAAAIPKTCVKKCIDCEISFNVESEVLKGSWYCQCDNSGGDRLYSFHCGCDKFQGEKIQNPEFPESENYFYCKLCFNEK